MIKKIFSIPGLIVFTLILVLAYCGFWMFLRSTVVSGVTDYISELESEGYRVDHGGLSIKGFPFNLNASSPNVAIQTTPNSPASASGSLSVETDDIEFKSPTLTPMSWTVQHRGELSVVMQPYNGPRYKFDMMPANIDMDVAYGLSGGLKTLSASMSRTHVKPLLPAEPAILALADLNAKMTVTGGSGHLDFVTKDIVVSEQVLGQAKNVLGQNIIRLEIKADIENWPLLELEGIESWMQSPAKIKSEDWKIRWGNVDFVGSFDLGFKNNLPEGVVRLSASRVEALLQSLISINLIDAGFAGQLNTVIGTIQSDENGRKTIELTIRDGVVKYGFFTLFRL